MNLTVYPLLLLWSLLGLVLFAPFFVVCRLLTRWHASRVMRLYIWLYGRGWLAITWPFVRFRRMGFATGALPTPCIMVVNHLSFFDTYFMGGLPIFDIAFAVRSWPFRMFWYAAFMRLAGYLDVEGDDWQTSLESCRETVARGGSILFFPEGHRSRDGRLRSFYSGAFRVAQELGVAVVPLVLTGTGRMLPPGRLWLQPSPVTLRLLPAFDPADYPGSAGVLRLRREVRGAMARALGETATEDAA
jgi:1-acyl-sn-glycerol-3-phosphate acyltransferase